MKFTRLPAFSLLEALLYMALLSGIIYAVGGFVNETLKARNKQQAVVAVETEANYLLERMEYDLKQAISLSAPAVGNPGSTLTMTVRPDATVETHSYTLTGTNIASAINAGAPIVLNSNRVQITAFTVTHISPATQHHTVSIAFTMKYINPGNRGDLQYQKDFRKIINLRPNQ